MTQPIKPLPGLTGYVYVTRPDGIYVAPAVYDQIVALHVSAGRHPQHAKAVEAALDAILSRLEEAQVEVVEPTPKPSLQ